MTEKDDTTIKLKNGTNYYGWIKQLFNSLDEKDLLTEKGELSSDPDSTKNTQIKKKQRIMVIKSIHPDLLEDIPNDIKEAQEYLDHLKAQFGSVNYLTYLSEMKNLKQTGSLDPELYLASFDKNFAKYRNSGGEMGYDMVNLFLLQGLDPWFAPYSGPRTTLMRTSTVDKAFYDASKAGILVHFADTPKPKDYKAMSALEEDDLPPIRRCTKCVALGRSERAIQSHHTNDHREFPKGKGKGKENKSSQEYLSIQPSTEDPVWDTAANDHFFKTKPSNYQNKLGTVATASGEKNLIVGQGDIEIGALKLKDVQHVPSFSHDLVSGTKLMTTGHDQTLTKNGDLFIYKNRKVVATGKYDNHSKLIKLDLQNRFAALTDLEDTNADIDSILENPTPSSNKSCPVFQKATLNRMNINVAHSIWGHCGETMLKRTARDQQITLYGKLTNCKTCSQTKTNQKKKKRKSPRFLFPLQQVHSDSQGPYPIVAIDGTKSNIKFVDAATSFIKMETIGDRTATTSLEAFKNFKVRSELKTERKIKEISTDPGTEFQGVFADYLKQEGITHLIGDSKKHHIPPFAERANQSTQKFGRASLLFSLLPVAFYALAQLYAVWILNRLVHVGQTKSPLELFEGKKPNLKKVVPFGQPGYAWIAEEDRNALENNRIPCRIVGFGEDDSVEESKGYHIFIPSNGTFRWSNDVLIDYDSDMTALSNEEIASVTDIDNIFIDPPYEPGHDDTYSLSDTDSDIFYSDIHSDIPSEPDFPDEPEFEQPAETNRRNPTRHNPQPNYVEWDSDAEETAYCVKTIECIKEHDISSVDDFLAFGVFDAAFIPQTHTQAMSCKEARFWREAELRELNSLKEKKTFGKAKMTPRGRKAVKSRWVYTKKFDENNNLIKFKARLVAKGFSQVYGEDYLETYSPVALLQSIRTLTAVAAAKNMKIHHMDVETAFLNAPLTKINNEDVLLELPEGAEILQIGKLVKVFRALYGFKQSPREWNLVLHEYLISRGFSQSKADPCLYIKNDSLFVAIYVDDLFICGSNQIDIDTFKTDMKNEFKMSDLGLLTWYLGIHFEQENNCIKIDQSQYIQSKLENFNFGPGGFSTPLLPNFQEILDNDDGIINTTFPYRSAVGSLIHLMRSTRPDIAVAVSIVSRYLDKPTETHIKMVKRIYFYLSTTVDYCLKYKPIDNSLVLVGYCDAAFANSNDSKSISGYGFLLSGSLVSWYAHTQPVVALSTAEAEYIAVTDAAKETIWLKLLLSELGIPQGIVSIREDNQATIKISKNPQDHRKTKHIQVKYHYIRDQIRDQIFRLDFVPTCEQLGDIFTKGLSGPRLRKILRELGVVRRDLVNERELNEPTVAANASMVQSKWKRNPCLQCVNKGKA